MSVNAENRLKPEGVNWALAKNQTAFLFEKVGYLALAVFAVGGGIYIGTLELLNHRTFISIKGIVVEVYNHLDNFSPIESAGYTIGFGVGGLALFSLFFLGKPDPLQKRLIILALALCLFIITFGSTLKYLGHTATHQGAWPKPGGIWEYHTFVQPEKIFPVQDLSLNLLKIGGITALASSFIEALARLSRKRGIRGSEIT